MRFKWFGCLASVIAFFACLQVAAQELSSQTDNISLIPFLRNVEALDLHIQDPSNYDSIAKVQLYRAMVSELVDSYNQLRTNPGDASAACLRAAGWVVQGQYFTVGEIASQLLDQFRGVIDDTVESLETESAPPPESSTVDFENPPSTTGWSYLLRYCLEEEGLPYTAPR